MTSVDTPPPPLVDADVVALAKRYVWWQEPAETIAAPDKLLCQLLKLGRPEDYRAARDRWGEATIVRALENALPGALDERSWVFWRRHFRLPDKPLPRRTFA